MGIFEIFKKRKTDTPVIKEKLTPEGDLPWGWVTRNKDFTEKTTAEYICVTNGYHYAQQTKEPSLCLQSLTVVVDYLTELEKYCTSMSECHEYWFYNILAYHDIVKEYKEELVALQSNYETLMDHFTFKVSTKPKIENLLKEYGNLLQVDLLKRFDKEYKNDVYQIIYELQNEGKIEKETKGNRCVLIYKDQSNM